MHTRWLALAVLAAACILVVTSRKGDHTPAVIGFIGDSISTSTYGLPQRVGTALGARIVDAAVSGTSTDDWLPGGSLYQRATALFTAGNVHVVHLMLGTNDARRLIRNSPTVYGAHLAAICRGLVGNGYVVVISVPPYAVPGSNHGDQDAEANRLRLAYRAQIAALANGTTIRLDSGDSYRLFANDPALLLDGIHPTQAGAAVLSSLWVAALRQAL